MGPVVVPAACAGTATPSASAAAPAPVTNERRRPTTRATSPPLWTLRKRVPRSHAGTHWSLRVATTLRARAGRVNAPVLVGAGLVRERRRQRGDHHRSAAQNARPAPTLILVIPPAIAVWDGRPRRPHRLDPVQSVGSAHAMGSGFEFPSASCGISARAVGRGGPDARCPARSAHGGLPRGSEGLGRAARRLAAARASLSPRPRSRAWWAGRRPPTSSIRTRAQGRRSRCCVLRRARSRRDCAP